MISFHTSEIMNYHEYQIYPKTVMDASFRYYKTVDHVLL